MRVLLDCDKQYRGMLKRQLDIYFQDIQYADTNQRVDIWIKQIHALNDLQRIQCQKGNQFIFLVENGNYMFELLEFRPICFIRLNEIEKDICEMIERLQYKIQGVEIMVDFQCGYQKVRLNAKNIQYIESYAHYLLIHSLHSTIKVRESISKALEKLAPLGFVRVHRSYIVNPAFIKKMDVHYVEMNQSQIIPIGKKFKDSF